MVNIHFTKPGYIVIVLYLNFALRLQVYLWFLEFQRVEREADHLVIRSVSSGNSSQLVS